MSTNLNELPMVRGDQITRVETFVDAAFAFALTMLVISVGNVPHDFPQFFADLLHIPCFVACFALIAPFWLGHNNVSRRFGLNDRKAVFLSLALVLTVLTFVYPLRAVIGLGFWYATNGLLPAELTLPAGGVTLHELEGAFIVYGVGYSLLCWILVLMYSHGLASTEKLNLSPREILLTKLDIRGLSINIAIAFLSIATAIALLLANWRDERWVGSPGFAYALLGVLMPWHAMRARRMMDALKARA